MSQEMERTPMQSISHLPNEALLRLTTVLSLFDNLSKSKWYAGIQEGKYPRPVKIDRSSRWVVGEIRALLTAFKNQSR